MGCENILEIFKKENWWQGFAVDSALKLLPSKEINKYLNLNYNSQMSLIIYKI